MRTRNEFHLFSSIVLSIVLWLTVIGNGFSQDYLFNTETINMKDGMPYRIVDNITQDKEGFIWISSRGTISRYDGYGFKTYSSSFLNTQSQLFYFTFDGTNRLWYCEDTPNNEIMIPHSGVIDVRKDTIYTMETISKGLFTSKDVVYIGKANNDGVLIVTRSGKIYAYNGNFEEIYQFKLPVTNTSFYCKTAPDGSYWIIHTNKLFQIKDKKLLKTFTFDNYVRDIVAYAPDFIIEVNQPTARYQKLENDTFVPFAPRGHKPGEIKKLFQVHKDYISYLIEKDELLVQDTLGNIIYRFDAFESAKGAPEVPPRFYPVKFLTDNQNTLWITYSNGLLKMSAKKNPFKVYKRHNGIRGIFQLGNKLWIGGYHEGIIRDLEKGTTQDIPTLKPFNAMTFHKDMQGHLWIGTFNTTLFKYIPDRDTYTSYALEKSAYLLHQNPLTKTYWTSTLYDLYTLDTTTGKQTPFPLLPAPETLYIGQFYQNNEGIWVVSNKGLFLIDAEKEVLIKHYSTADGLPSNNINYLHEDDNGIFWLGTKDSGLVRWDRSDNTFMQYTRENGLSNNNIYAVYEDGYQTLWLPSDYGLMAFDKNTATTTKVYLTQNGIPHEEFNTHGHFKADDGTLYFGSQSGAIQFHPAALREETSHSSPLYATRVRVLEKDGQTYADKTAAYLEGEKVNLDPGERIIEVELTLLDYENSSENRYAYKLSGKQQQWIYTQDNKISIINPPYGRYDLIVKARGASGVWSENPIKIPMHVKAPFYMQWWFILIMIVLLAGAVFLWFRRRVQKLKKDRERLETEVQKRTQKIEAQAEELKALDKAKSRFFANLTHEFRTPLTLVTGPVKQIIEENPPVSIKKRLHGVLKNTRNLLGLINQLLDLSKLEGGRMKLEVVHGDIVRYTKELTNRFQSLADAKQLQLKFTADMEVWKIHFDSDKWTKILYNLLSNAIKFTFEGCITVQLSQVQQENRDYIECIVKDTGMGIAPEKLEHIFDRFYQGDASSTRLQGGTGIGLSLVKELVELQSGSVTVSSTAGRGTEFTVRLPVLSASDTETTVLPIVTETSLSPIPDDISWPRDEQPATTGIQEKLHTEKLELLIVEDNAEMRSYIRSCIDETAYHITEAANGKEGVEKALEIVPDLIICDVMMPEKNGFEVTQAIRSHTATSHIPLILLTAKASLESRLEGLKRGADAYLTKPFSPEELSLRIKKLIELRKLLQQRYQNKNEPPEENAAFEKEDSFVSELKAYITNHSSEPNLGVEDISKHFSMSRSQCYRKFKALINASVGHYIRTIRLEKAMHLLKEKQLNITEVAHETGFSPSNFSKVFKKTYGKAPSELL